MVRVLCGCIKIVFKSQKFGTDEQFWGEEVRENILSFLGGSRLSGIF